MAQTLKKQIISFLSWLAAGIVFIVLLAGLVKFSARHNIETAAPGQKMGEIEMRSDINNPSIYK
jgi:hypothetical protein